MKPAQIIVLCEDKQQEVFVRRFLKPRTNHPIRVVSAPAGEGSGVWPVNIWYHVIPSE